MKSVSILDVALYAVGDTLTVSRVQIDEGRFFQKLQNARDAVLPAFELLGRQISDMTPAVFRAESTKGKGIRGTIYLQCRDEIVGVLSWDNTSALKRNAVDWTPLSKKWSTCLSDRSASSSNAPSVEIKVQRLPSRSRSNDKNMTGVAALGFAGL